MPTTRKQARLYSVLLILLGTSIAVALTLTALSDNVSYFRTPSDIVTHTYLEYASGHAFRLGGLVEKGSLVHDGANVSFRVTDLKNTLVVHYQGGLPDLFREGQGVVAEGKMQDDVFIATNLLAKHDEKYMPPEVARELKNSGAAP